MHRALPLCASLTRAHAQTRGRARTHARTHARARARRRARAQVSCGYGCMIDSNDAAWTPPDFNK